MKRLLYQPSSVPVGYDMTHWTDRYYSNEPQKISTRNRTCGCGCAGSDPWHRWTQRRVVRRMTRLSHPEKARTLSCDTDPDDNRAPGRTVIVATGVARFPWGVRRVGLEASIDSRTGCTYIVDWIQIDGLVAL